jgi:hypothetical protein
MGRPFSILDRYIWSCSTETLTSTIDRCLFICEDCWSACLIVWIRKLRVCTHFLGICAVCAQIRSILYIQDNAFWKRTDEIMKEGGFQCGIAKMQKRAALNKRSRELQWMCFRDEARAIDMMILNLLWIWNNWSGTDLFLTWIEGEHVKIGWFEFDLNSDFGRFVSQINGWLIPFVLKAYVAHSD